MERSLDPVLPLAARRRGAEGMSSKMLERLELFDTSLGVTPMGRCGEPSEAAAAAAFLALPASSHATGQFFQSTVATRSGEGGGA
jgi:NAD(P)-dependent dehydrogenase (short-subunit alcohol dehydrogenase family)